MAEVPVQRPFGIVIAYEAELKNARRWARILGTLHAFSKFLAFCNLTWATVALLGAFLPYLNPIDFGFVTSLLFIEAGRLFVASFFLRLLMRPLVYVFEDSKIFQQDKDATLLRCTSHVVQFLLLAPGFVLPIIGHIRLRGYLGILNLRSSLRIFYSFVAFNTLVAPTNLICSLHAFLVFYKPKYLQRHEQSILMYFDTVLDRAISSGDLIRADVFEFFNFAYTMLGAQFQQQKSTKNVAQNNKMLIMYLHAHSQGFEVLKSYLEADDKVVQLAAVNIMRFWFNWIWPGPVEVQEMECRPKRVPEELLTELADKVGMGTVGRAAIRSFDVLAGTPAGAQVMAETRTSSNIGLLDRVVKLLDDSGARALPLVSLLVGFYEQYCVNKQQPPRLCEQEGELVGKLRKLAREARSHRQRVMSAYLLLLMDKRSTCDRDVILAINPVMDSFWYKSEVEMLELLFRSHIPEDPDRLKFVNFPKIYQQDAELAFARAEITVPDWARAP